MVKRIDLVDVAPGRDDEPMNADEMAALSAEILSLRDALTDAWCCHAHVASQLGVEEAKRAASLALIAELQAERDAARVDLEASSKTANVTVKLHAEARKNAEELNVALRTVMAELDRIVPLVGAKPSAWTAEEIKRVLALASSSLPPVESSK